MESDSAPEGSTLYLLPWLRAMNAPIVVGPYTVAEWRRLEHERIDIPDSAENIVGTYLLDRTHPAWGSLMWPTGQSPFGSLRLDDRTSLRLHTEVLALASIAENRYFTQAAEPITAAHFESFFHQFTPGTDFIATGTRRRDGDNTHGGLALSSVMFTAPPGGQVQARALPEQTFLDALATGIATPSDVDERIERSLPHFLDGNRLDDYDVERDLVGLAAALEQLLDITSPQIGHKLANALDATFPSFTPDATVWTDRGGNQTPCTWLYRWAREFYDHRSAIHGKPAANNTWMVWEHGLIATVMYCLAVKVLLVAEGRYNFIRRDEQEVQALEARVTDGSPVMARWESAYTEAGWTVASRKAAARFEQADAEDEQPEQ